MRGGFLLDPDVVYLNHGAYGATPVEVFDEYQRWQRELERAPTDLFARRFDTLLGEARARLAEFVGAAADDLVFAPNATSALNAVLRSLRIEAGEEVLTTRHEYGAVLRTLAFTGANLVLCEPHDVVARIRSSTRAVLVSHITSPTAQVVPVEEICAGARDAGVLAIVDGAHAPGHVAVDVRRIGADVYAGNCHKWLCAPKGSGFLWASPEHHRWIEPTVVSWGFHEDADFGERHGWQGTRDPSAYLAVPCAIDVHRGFDHVGMQRLADEGERELAELGMQPVGTSGAPFMRALRIPTRPEPDELWRRLYEEQGVEVPVYEWEGETIVRLSIGPYNDESDIERLVAALRLAL